MEIVHEEWQAVVGLEGQHEVSNLGRVRSLGRIVVRRVGRPFFRPEKILSGNVTGGHGYKTVNIGGRNRYVHRLVLEAFVGPCPNGNEGCHGNGNRTDNRLSNLRWDTPQANQMDRATHGTSNRGERSAKARLTETQAREILGSKERGCELARRYGIAQQTVCGIRKGRKWAHLAETRTA